MVALHLSEPQQTRGAQHHFLSLTAASMALLLVSLVALTLDPRTLAGVNVWVKPAKFALSFAVMFATMAFVVDRLSGPVQTGRVVRISLIASIAMFSFEMAYIMVQSGRGEASHFNSSSTFTIVMYAAMGLGAVILVAAVAAIGWVAGRDHAARLSPGLRAGIVSGFLSSTVLTLIVAGYMGSTPGHFVGVPGANAPTIPLLGWSAQVGDLRPAHFASLHAMQVLPVFGWLLDRVKFRRIKLAMGAATFAWAALTAVLFLQALAGKPIIAL